MGEPSRFCYHCRKYHPISEMKLMSTKSGKRWRCKTSLMAAKRSQLQRDAYGKQVSEINSRVAADHARRLPRDQET